MVITQSIVFNASIGRSVDLCVAGVGHMVPDKGSVKGRGLRNVLCHPWEGQEGELVIWLMPYSLCHEIA